MIKEVNKIIFIYKFVSIHYDFCCFDMSRDDVIGFTNRQIPDKTVVVITPIDTVIQTYNMEMSIVV